MATPSTNTLTATITATDANGNTSINRGLGSPSLQGNTSKFVESASQGVGTYSLLSTSDPSNIFNIYIKNNSAPGSAITLTPVITPNGGVAQTLAPLQPGGVLLIWQQTNTIAGGGYSVVSVTVAGGTCLFEFFVGS